jgi:DNA-binding NarL/FixJ family response regulator
VAKSSLERFHAQKISGARHVASREAAAATALHSDHSGLTNKQIAEKLSISEATVRHHLIAIFSKLGVSRSELTAYSYRHHLVSSGARAGRDAASAYV